MSPARDVPLRRFGCVRAANPSRTGCGRSGGAGALLLRLSLATSIAYFIATEVLDHRQAFFAPIAAIVALISGGGARVRTVLELVFGVAIGVLVGELLILGIGRGAVADGSRSSRSPSSSAPSWDSPAWLSRRPRRRRCCSTAVIPFAGSGNPAVTRFLDALVGGLVGLAMVLLDPAQPGA